ncbi:unnamed protein product [Tetraodon nigroviridis]|uniref:(spotted green pufferfish) hypothetical protein n=1 Tax=Tetraodon nigroviridis TaxID=99883 RepID=Q4RNB5_TETNG|nr:unnamed protein product [Tetraodon nigroviridis]
MGKRHIRDQADSKMRLMLKSLSVYNSSSQGRESVSRERERRREKGGLFPTESHEYEVFRFALSHHQDIPKLVPQVDMVKMGNSFSMTYACKYCWQSIHLGLFPPLPTWSVYQLHKERLTPNLHRRRSPPWCAAQTRGLGCELNCCAGPRNSHLPRPWSQRDFARNLCSNRLESSLNFINGCHWSACAPPPPSVCPYLLFFYENKYVCVYMYIYIYIYNHHSIDTI